VSTESWVPKTLAVSCPHERGHISDSAFYGHCYGTETSRRIFCDICRYQRWLDVEAALAIVQGEVGLLPEDVGRAIADAAHVENLDLTAVRRSIRESGHSLVGLLRAFQDVCPGKSGQYVHYGATTQDIQDTAQSLEMRNVLDELDRLLRLSVTSLVSLAERHGSALALGRTHAQPAVPLTVGVKIAGWIGEILRHAERTSAMRSRVLAVQIFGAAGTMAGFDTKGLEILDRLAARLGLTAPTTAWHVARDRVAEFVSTLAMVAATMGRITDEIRLLSRPEIGEVEERWHHGAIGSSTMPHKRNPEVCEQVVALSRLATGLVGPALLAMGGDGERDARALRIEWACIPDISHYCLAACEMTSTVLARLQVNRARLRANLEAASDQIASEKLMLALADRLGKQTAYDRLYEVIARARENDRAVRDELLADPELGRILDTNELDRIFDPVNHLGASEQVTQRVIAAATSWLDGQPLTVAMPRHRTMFASTKDVGL